MTNGVLYHFLATPQEIVFYALFTYGYLIVFVVVVGLLRVVVVPRVILFSMGLNKSAFPPILFVNLRFRLSCFYFGF